MDCPVIDVTSVGFLDENLKGSARAFRLREQKSIGRIEGLMHRLPAELRDGHAERDVNRSAREDVDEPPDRGPEAFDGAFGGLAWQRLEFRDAISMGLKSGLQGGRNRNVAPSASIRVWTEARLWLERLSRCPAGDAKHRREG